MASNKKSEQKLIQEFLHKLQINKYLDVNFAEISKKNSYHELVLEAIRQDGFIVPFILAELKDNKDIILDVVMNNVDIIFYMQNKSDYDKEFKSLIRLFVYVGKIERKEASIEELAQVIAKSYVDKDSSSDYGLILQYIKNNPDEFIKESQMKFFSYDKLKFAVSCNKFQNKLKNQRKLNDISFNFSSF